MRILFLFASLYIFFNGLFCCVPRCFADTSPFREHFFLRTSSNTFNQTDHMNQIRINWGDRDGLTTFCGTFFSLFDVPVEIFSSNFATKFKQLSSFITSSVQPGVENHKYASDNRSRDGTDHARDGNNEFNIIDSEFFQDLVLLSIGVGVVVPLICFGIPFIILGIIDRFSF